MKRYGLRDDQFPRIENLLSGRPGHRRCITSPTGHNQPPERTQNWIKLGGKATAGARSRRSWCHSVDIVLIFIVRGPPYRKARAGSLSPQQASREARVTDATRV